MGRVCTVNPVPVVVKGEARCLDCLSAGELEELNRSLLHLLGLAVKAATEQLKRLGEEARLSERLGVLNDTLILSIRRAFSASLIPPSLREGSGEAVARLTPLDLLYVWLLLRRDVEDVLVKETLVERPVLHMKEEYGEGRLYYDRYEKLFEKYEPVRTVIGLSPASVEEAEKRLEILLRLPADTRHGNNASKLIPHLLTVSALASSIYLSRAKNPSRLELEVLRLAAILHDLGKPGAWLEHMLKGSRPSHALKGRELAERMGLDKLLGREGGKILEAVSRLVEAHHNPSSLGEEEVATAEGGIRLRLLAEILSRADRVASGVDRLGPLLAGKLSAASGNRVSRKEMERLLTRSGPRIWEEWEKLEDLAEKLGSEACKNLSLCRHEEAGETLAKLLGEAEAGGEEDVLLLLADVKGVQRFIGRETIRAVIAASMLVDVLTQYAIPRAIMESYGVPPEAVIYAGGGFAVALVPNYPDAEDRAKKLGERAKNIVFGGTGFGPGVVAVVSPLYSSWPASMLRASVKLKMEKLRAGGPGTLLTGYEQTCSICGVNPASIEWRGERVCDECKALVEFGENVYIKYRLELLRRAGYKAAKKLLDDRALFKSMMDRLIEWLSGEERWQERTRDIAIVKADGNAMGLFMADAVNVSDALARSLRVDLGLKMGLQEALKALLHTHRGPGEEMVVRCFTGILYAGGDDLLAIWPSSISLPLSLIVGRVFWSFCGYCRQLSVAVVGGKAKYNLWNTIDAAAALLRRCKSRYREAKRRGLKDREIVAIVSFYHSEAQPLPPMAVSAVKRYGDLRLSLQPYLYYREPRSLKERCLAGFMAPLFEGGQAGLVEALLEAAWDVEDRVKPLLRALREVQAMLQNYADLQVDKQAKVFATYVARQVARLGREADIAGFEAYARTVVDEEIMPPLYDLYLLLKLLEGGGR